MHGADSEWLVHALRACSRELGGAPVSRERYRSWSRVCRATGTRGVPASVSPFLRAFGTWRAALNAAGVGQHLEPRISEEECRQSLRAVARNLGRTPSSTEYLRVRAELRAARVPRRLVSYAQLNRRYPSWRDAVAAAGLSPKRLVARPRVAGRERIGRERLLGSLREAASDIGRPPSTHEFERWRRDRQALPSASVPTARIPSVGTFQNRFGSWENACVEAVGVAFSRRRTHGGDHRSVVGWPLPRHAAS